MKEVREGPTDAHHDIVQRALLRSCTPACGIKVVTPRESPLDNRVQSQISPSIYALRCGVWLVDFLGRFVHFDWIRSLGSRRKNSGRTNRQELLRRDPFAVHLKIRGSLDCRPQGGSSRHPGWRNDHGHHRGLRCCNSEQQRTGIASGMGRNAVVLGCILHVDLYGKQSR